MAIKFYSKPVPRTPILIPGTTMRIQFETLDNATGFYSTQHEVVQNAFTTMIEAGEFGLSELSQEQYFAQYYDKKKGGMTPLPALNRESIGGRGYKPAVGIPQTQRPSPDGAVVTNLKGAVIETKVPAGAVAVPVAPVVSKPFTPNTGSRPITPDA